MIRLAIIGAGNVGATLGKRLRDQGHSVRWGVPDPTRPKYEGLDVTTVADAVEGAVDGLVDRTAPDVSSGGFRTLLLIVQ